MKSAEQLKISQSAQDSADILFGVFSAGAGALVGTSVIENWQYLHHSPMAAILATAFLGTSLAGVIQGVSAFSRKKILKIVEKS